MPFNLLLCCFVAFLFFAPAASAGTVEPPPPIAWQIDISAINPSAAGSEWLKQQAVWERADIEADRARAQQLARIAGGLADQAAALKAQAAAIADLSHAIAAIKLDATVNADLSPVTAKLDQVIGAIQAIHITTTTTAQPPPPTGPININTATLAELESLPHIGPALAQRLIADRPFQTVDDLTRIRGIGVKTLAELRPLVIVTDAPRQEPTTQPPPRGNDDDGAGGVGGVTIDMGHMPHTWALGTTESLTLPAIGSGPLAITITPVRDSVPVATITLTGPPYQIVAAVLNKLSPGDYSLYFPTFDSSSLLTVVK